MKTSAPAVSIRAREGRILPSKVQPLSGAGETRGLGGAASDFFGVALSDPRVRNTSMLVRPSLIYLAGACWRGACQWRAVCRFCIRRDTGLQDT